MIIILDQFLKKFVNKFKWILNNMDMCENYFFEIETV